MRFVVASTLALSLATAAVPALAACFDAWVYEEVRQLLASLPTPRERAALADRELAAAHDRADAAFVAFLDTEPDRDCRDAEAARSAMDAAVDDLVALGGLEAGKCCESWNSSTGGTNCTPTDDTTCPGDLFYCEPSPSGCF